MKKEYVEYICSTGKHRYKTEYKGWYPTTSCKRCGKPAQMASIAESKGTVLFKRYREPVAFVTDKRTGQELAMDKKGRKFEVDKTRYDLNRDPRGWKATGKKFRKTDKYGNPVLR